MDEFMHFLERLQHYKKTNPFVPGFDEPGRHTYCHIMALHNGKWHKFEVRGHNITMDYGMVEISAVNWTMAAGTCTLSIQREQDVSIFKILEDEPTMQVLYG